MIFFLLLLQLQIYSFAQAKQNKQVVISPQKTGLRVAEHFFASSHGVYNAPGTKPHIPDFEVCARYGALGFAQLTRNVNLLTKFIERFSPLFDKDSALLPVPDHVDYTVFGTIPLEIFLQTKETKYYELGKMYADKQWGTPEGPRVTATSYTFYNKDYTWQTRLWIDDMNMITLIQSQAYHATGDEKYIDRAAEEMILYLHELQKPSGLFFHAKDIPFYLGRGNGWMAAGMTELLRVLPKKNKNRPQILKAYQFMMATLLQYQASDGMWRQQVDDTASWKETSCTGMFTYAMSTGVERGWLKKSNYKNAAYKAWNALTTYINDKGEITDVNEGTGAKNDRDYYLNRKRITGDFHGQAPILWCANALLRKKEN